MSNNIRTHKDLLSALKKTEVMDSLLKCLEEEPVYLLGVICRIYEQTGQQVPDHQVHPSGYLGDISLKALIATNLIKRLPGDRLALARYEPTQEGMKVYSILVNEGVCSTAGRNVPSAKPGSNEKRGGGRNKGREKKPPAG